MIDHAIVWLREDFRLTKNRALFYAAKNHKYVSVIYLYKKNSFEDREAQKWLLFNSIKSFSKQLDKLRISLETLACNSYLEAFEKYFIKIKNCSFYWNKVYEPNYLKFDLDIAQILQKNEISYKIFKGNILNEPQEVKKEDGSPLKVFTPFWKRAEKIYLDKEYSAPDKIKVKEKKKILFKDQFNIEGILPKKTWYKKFENYWLISEEEAKKRLKKFIDGNLENYGKSRDIPSELGTSKMSVYLSAGLISAEEIFERCQNTKKGQGYRKYINEIGWREFSYSLINNFPIMIKKNLRKEFDNFPWAQNESHLKAWKKGLTGYPIVDAGMRELYEIGWMHNRVRMITASFLVKHLRIHWMEGEKYFRNTLLDYNLANNICGWQWVAGTGADAAPYFRIFNPILQGEKFDPKGTYVKKWIPELKNVPDKFIHKPWELNQKISNYPAPIVDHNEAREKALMGFQKIKK